MNITDKNSEYYFPNMLAEAFKTKDMTPGSFAFYYASDLYTKTLDWWEKDRERDIRLVYSSRQGLGILVAWLTPDLEWMLTSITRSAIKTGPFPSELEEEFTNLSD